MSDFVEIELELEEELIEFIEKAAKEEGITQDEFINKALASFLEQHEEDLENYDQS
jgi:metal-responsive CopG/Arc/MetJ family transcriptional regulator